MGVRNQGGPFGVKKGQTLKVSLDFRSVIDAPGTPSRALPSRLLGIDGDGIFVKAVLNLEPWERWRPRRRGSNETQERWFSLRTVRQS